ncbi:MAG: adenosine deaminase [Bryobacteraceae bacterium]
MRQFIERLPKAELHLHLEGSMEPETLAELDPAVSIEEAERMYRYPDFAGFLASYVWAVRKLTRPEHYALITRRLLERLQRQNVLYAEITLSAGVILWRKQDLAEVYLAIQEEAAKSPVQVYWVFDSVRQFGVELAQTVAERAVEYAGSGVVAYGIGGDEEKGPASWFKDVFAFTTRNGLRAVPHAGESVGPQSVWDALKLGADRIGHGISAAQDAALMKHLREAGIPLEVCISSNVCTGVVASLRDHPVRRLYDAGVPVVLNTDDPPMFQTTLNNEYEIAAREFGFSETELSGLAANSFRYAFRYRKP